MPGSQKNPKSDVSMSAFDALYHRRSVRDYKPGIIEKDVIHTLLDAAVHAPNAMREEPWSFAVIQDKKLLSRLSESVKDLVRKESKTSPKAKRALDRVNDPDFKIFYNAGTLIVICGKIQDSFAAADCWLAAENLMLAACAKGLGSCVIGFAVAALNTPEWKSELKIPGDMMAIAPIILGVPATETPPVPRKEPKILAWR